MTKEKSLTKNVVLNFINAFLSLCFPLITFPYSSRVLLPQGIGKVHFAQSIIQYFSLVAGLGIMTYGIRECAKLRDNKHELSKFTKEILIINFVSTLFSYLLLFVFIFSVPKIDEYKILLIICSAVITLSWAGVGWLNIGLEDFRYRTIRSIIFQSIGVVCLFIFVKKPDDYVQYAIVSVIGNVGTDICNIIYATKHVSLRGIKNIDIKKHIKPIMTFFAMMAATYIYTALDTTMLGFLSNDAEVGIYSAATKINRAVLTLVTSIGAVLLPRLSYYVKINDEKEYKFLVGKIFSLFFLLSLPCCIELGILARPIILLFSGESYLPAVTVMRIMNPIIVIVGFSNLLGNQILIPLGKEKWQLCATIVAALSNFILNIILIPKYQALGAAIATICAETISMLIQFLFSLRLVKITKVLLSFIKYILNACVMSVSIMICAIYIENIALKTIFGLFFGSLTYFILLLLEKDEFIANSIIFEKAKYTFSGNRFKSRLRHLVDKLASYHVTTQNLLHNALYSTEVGVDLNSDLIVSLTTYDKYINDVHLAIESLLEQSVKPQRLILWISDATKDEDIPYILRLQEKRGLEIRKTKDILSYKKLIPTLKDYPNNPIITFDDDCIYPFNAIEELYKNYKKNPELIYFRVGRKLELKRRKSFRSYSHTDKKYLPEVSPLNFPVGCGGVLYPPHCFESDVFDEETFMTICPTADDIWFKAMSLKKGVLSKGVYVHGEPYMDIDIFFENQMGRLNSTNIDKKENDTQLKSVWNKYKLWNLLNV